MSKVALVTDSTAYIPGELQNKYAIQIAPQVLIWDGKTYLDGVDIQPLEYYTRLNNSPTIPTTSQASSQSFQKIYASLLEEDYQILTVVLSEKLSGTLISARQAREDFPGAPIEIVDSTTTAMAMGFLVLEAARAAAQGASLQECKDLVLKSLPCTGVLFAVDTLEFLHRGGRIGGGARLLGTALNLKPILEVTDGRVEAVERIRTRKKSLSRLVELAVERIGDSQPVHLATLHANARDDAQLLLELAQEKLHVSETVFSEVSPVVGTHAGPGTVGLAYLAGI